MFKRKLQNTLDFPLYCLILKGSDRTWVYNSATDSWTSGPKMRKKRISHSCRTAVDSNGNKKIIVVGGSDTARASSEVFDLATKTWKAGPKIPGASDLEGATLEASDDVTSPSAAFLFSRKNIWKLTRDFKKWEELTKQMKIQRRNQSTIPITNNFIPGCSSS